MENFKKIFFIFILFFLAFNNKSYAEMVKKVEIKGNERISLETIVIFGDITTDKDYESSDINLLIKKLYETTFFSNISAIFIFESFSKTLSISINLIFNFFEIKAPIVDFPDPIIPIKIRFFFDFISFFIEKTQICLNLKLLHDI